MESPEVSRNVDTNKTVATGGAGRRTTGGTAPGAVEHRRIVVIGAGFGGLGMAIRLLQKGIRDFVVLEKGSDVGGTWRDNTYPGCQCDVASNMYSFSFAQNPSWSRSFAMQPEIFQYLKDCADKFGARPFIRFDTELVSAKWNDAAQRWFIETNKGSLTADLVVSGHGGLSAPSTPELPGLERFKGTVFHSAAWNHEHDLTGERVAVVGTGASAIQIIPSIQPKVRELTVFQRTPPWVVPRLDFPNSEPKKSLYRSLPFVQDLGRRQTYLTREIVVLAMRGNKLLRKSIQRVAKMHLEHQVKDPELRAKLLPNYEIGCKRILLSNDYYPALAAKNSKVVTDGIREVTERGIVTNDGTLHEVDSLVLATGFKVADHPITKTLFGTDGRSLSEHWDSGAAAYLGTTISGFPNLFLLTGPNTGLGHNSIIYMLEAQFEYILGALATLDAENLATLDVRPEAMKAFAEEMQAELKGTVWNSGCASWYLDAQGRNTTVWPTFTWRFKNRTREFDAAAYSFEPRRTLVEPRTVAAAV
jgi:cation diffusion facilitator CzcD-associated flavoprotein CzcO